MGKGNIGNMMKQVQQMQEKMQKIQEELEQAEVEGSFDGRLVTTLIKEKLS